MNVFFTLPGITDYVIEDNRRSTKKIIDVLNSARTDLSQNSTRNIDGCKPILYVGDIAAAYVEAQGLCSGQVVATLSWDNITANAMKRQAISGLSSVNMVDDLFSKDTNSERRKAILCCSTSLELARQKRFKEAIKELQRLFRHISDRSERKKIAFNHLSHLLGHYDSFKNQPLMSFYQMIKANIFTGLAGFRAGAANTFYTICTYEQLSISVNIKDDDTPNRTIHKAKGDEFDNVMLILKEESGLTFLLSPNLAVTELHRLYYVAISRARERLFISVPELAASKETRLSALFEIKRI